MTSDTRAHWENVYQHKGVTEVSWYEASPLTSLKHVHASNIDRGAPILDVGGGAALLVDALLLENYRKISILDISNTVLENVRARLGPLAESVQLIQSDVLTFEPTVRYALWHDRAVFHFLVERGDRERYVEVLKWALIPDGQVIIATFGPNGPQKCSGLPVSRYNTQQLAAELGSEFKLVDSELVTHRTPAGAQQEFLYCRFERHA